MRLIMSMVVTMQHMLIDTWAQLILIALLFFVQNILIKKSSGKATPKSHFFQHQTKKFKQRIQNIDIIN